MFRRWKNLRRLLIVASISCLATTVILHAAVLPPRKPVTKQYDDLAMIQSLNRSDLEELAPTVSTVPQKHSLCLGDDIIKSSKVTKLGRYPQSKRYLSIGIASIERPSGTNYLLKTTQSLIDNMSDEDKNNTYIVIFLADLHEPPKSRAKEEISKSFGKYIDQGLLTVIEAYPEYYPPLTNLKEKYGDSDSRRAWRSKENVDATFVMCYCKDLSQYYIHLEDDVISSPSFFPKLQDFINAQKGPSWSLLDVAVQGSKAKVYHSKDLANIASYFYLLYDEMPIDWLMSQWRKIKETSPRLRLPSASLFQHIGERSSLKENAMSGVHQREPFFDQYDQKYKGLNPPASVTSSLASHQGKPQDAYDKGGGFFWARRPQKDDYLLIEFNTFTTVRRVIIATGCYQAKSDLLRSAVIQASFEPPESEGRTKNSNSCGNFKTLGPFLSGRADVSVKTFRKVACLRILVMQYQRFPVYFREINVWQ